MTKDDRDTQWQQTLDVASTLKNRPAKEAGSPPQPGELYLSHRTSDLPVEWLVLASSAEQCQLLPVDDYPLAGSRDLELPTEATGGQSVVRCGYGAAVPPRRLEPELRTQVLPPAVLEQVRMKWQQVEGNTLEPTLLESVVDSDPEYERWCEGTLQSAVAALEKPEEKPLPAPLRFIRQPKRWLPVLAVAALLAMVFGLGQAAYRLSQQLETSQGQIAELQQQSSKQADLLDQQVEQVRESASVAQELQTLLEEARNALGTTGEQLLKVKRDLSQAIDLGTAINIPKLHFGKKNRFTRGSATRGQPLLLKASAPGPVLIEVEVVDAEPYATYRLLLQPTQAGKPMQIEGLDRDGATLRLVLSADEAVPGEYNVLIQGLGMGKPVELDERYRLTVEP